MKLLTLAWAGMWRKPTRTSFTVLSLAVGFLLFGLLQGINSTFSAALNRTRADRLLIDPRFGKPLLRSDATQVAGVPGVRELTWTRLLLGYYQDRKNFVLTIVTDAPTFFKVRTEYVTTAAQLDKLARTRTGLLVLDTLASKYHWKVGDRVTLQSDTAQQNGSHAWDFDIVGVMTCPSNSGQVPFAVANYDYINEAQADGKGTVGRFVVRVTDPGRSLEIGRSIDARFASSPTPTLSQLENAYAGAELATIGDVGRLTVAVIGAVFFAIVFLAGNVILQSVRDRTAEFAVLKTLGFSDARVLCLVMLEALLLCTAGAVLGLAASEAVFPIVGAYLPTISLYLSTRGLSPYVIAIGFAIALVLTIVAGLAPAWIAKRLNIADALRMRV